MEHLFSYVCVHAPYAHWIIFSLLLLSGLNIPLSEELLILSGGAIAAACIPDHTYRLYFWIFLGCYLSAWIAYSIGRFFGPYLSHIPLARNVITAQRLEHIRHYLSKFGIFTFILGRFCPGGIRNALFISSGLTRMPFPLFIFRDGIACLISSSVFFTLGYHFGKNYQTIVYHFVKYEHWFAILFLILGSIGLVYLWMLEKNKK